MRFGVITVLGLRVCVVLSAAPGAGALAIVCSDGGCGGAQAGFQATGSFTSVDTFDATSSTPLLSAISGYGYVYAYTNSVPANGSALGDLLKSYYDLGGKHLVVATYGFSTPWAISGGIATGNYAALTNVGTNGDVSGNLVAVVPADPIFAGVNLGSLVYFHNSNFAHPGVAMGATLLATDGAGVNMIARSANGVVDVNLFAGNGQTNTTLFRLLANALGTSGGNIGVPTAPIPSTFLLLLIGMGCLVLYQTRDRWMARIRVF